MALILNRPTTARTHTFEGRYEDTDVETLAVALLWCQDHDVEELFSVSFDEDPSKDTENGAKYLYLTYVPTPKTRKLYRERGV